MTEPTKQMIEMADRLFNDHVTREYGWTAFAKMHTNASGASYEQTYKAGALAAIMETQDRVAALEGALQDILEHATKLRAGTDDWFEMAEFQTFARQALLSRAQQGGVEK